MFDDVFSSYRVVLATRKLFSNEKYDNAKYVRAMKFISRVAYGVEFNPLTASRHNYRPV